MTNETITLSDGTVVPANLVTFCPPATAAGAKTNEYTQREINDQRRAIRKAAQAETQTPILDEICGQ